MNKAITVIEIQYCTGAKILFSDWGDKSNYCGDICYSFPLNKNIGWTTLKFFYLDDLFVCH